MPKVSVIIPTFNSELYIRETLESVIHQTLEDIEIIVVDADSKDNTLNIIEEYIAKDSRIKILKRPKEFVGISRNAAIEIATGDYIMFLDSDDWYEKNACEIVYNKIAKENADIVLFGYKKVYKDKIQMVTWNFEDMYNAHGENLVSDKEAIPFFGLAACEPWKKIYKRSFINNNNIRFSEHNFGEDVPFCWRALIAMSKASLCHQYLYNYRQALNVNTGAIDSRFSNNFAVFKLVYKELLNSNKAEPYMKWFILSVIRNYRYWTGLISKKSKIAYFKEMKAEFKKFNKEHDVQELLKSHQTDLNYFLSVLKMQFIDFKIFKLPIFQLIFMENNFNLNILGIKIKIRGKK